MGRFLRKKDLLYSQVPSNYTILEVPFIAVT